MIDTGKDVVVWVGKNASKAEKKSGLMYAHVSMKAFFVAASKQRYIVDFHDLEGHIILRGTRYI